MGLSRKEQVELFMQGTEYGDSALAASMAAEMERALIAAEAERRPLRVYCGFDPRTSDLHIGHTVPIRKLRQFQEQGHEVMIVVGTYTSTIGDPSDQDRLRNRLTTEEAIANGRTYAAQAFRILDPERTTVRYNHEWLQGLRFEELIEMGSLFSLQQFLTRDAFRKRWDRGDAVYLHETFYSLMQAYDACHLRADVQVGGSDQLFNIVTASRKLMAARGLAPNIAVILGILPGTDGTVKMSKSLGNHIPIDSPPEDMYGKVMSIPDQAMGDFFRLASRRNASEIAEILGAAGIPENPMRVKRILAWEITEIFHGNEQARRAEAHFDRVIRGGMQPEQMPEARVPCGTQLIEVIVENALAGSRTEARRLISQGAVRFEGERVTDPQTPFERDGVLQVGKRRYLRVTLTGGG